MVTDWVQPNSKKQKIEFYRKQKLNLARVSKQFLISKWSQAGFSMIIPGLRPKEGRLHLGDPSQRPGYICSYQALRDQNS